MGDIVGMIWYLIAVLGFKYGVLPGQELLAAPTDGLSI